MYAPLIFIPLGGPQAHECFGPNEQKRLRGLWTSALSDISPKTGEIWGTL
jgi:hypothetical protein